ncbi:hypothetical protein LINGRAHAP2_LOCUS13634 [Linum grandiflorum]
MVFLKQSVITVENC